MTRFIVCHEWANPMVINGCFVSNNCRIIEWNARNSGRNLCRSTCTTSALISLRKIKLTLKHSRHRLCLYGLPVDL